MLRHQLDASLHEDLSLVFRSARAALADVSIRTFGELLHHPAPPVEALRMVKDFAKQLHSQARHAYPEDVATVLYFASIAAAALRAGAAISNLPASKRHEGYAWARSRTWLPTELKPLFDEALKKA